MRKSLFFLLSTVNIKGWPFSGGADFLDQISSLKPAPILLDIRMSDLDGIEVLDQLNVRGIGWPVIIMSGHGDIGIAVRAIKLGAIEFLEKPFTADALGISIAMAQERLSQDAAKLAQREDARRRLAKLTAREDQVVKALMDGAANKQVAHQLDLSTRTVEMYRASALAKLGVKTIVEVAALYSAAA